MVFLQFSQYEASVPGSFRILLHYFHVIKMKILVFSKFDEQFKFLQKKLDFGDYGAIMELKLVTLMHD